MTCLGIILFAIFCYALSWLVTVGIIYLVTLCFGLAWSLPIATGIWLVLMLFKTFMSTNLTIKK